MHHSRTALLFLVLTLFGCVKKEVAVTKRDQAIELLNRREYLQAIEVLRELHAENPHDNHIRILLASAYSGSIGLNVVDSFSAFEPLLTANAQRSGFGLAQADAAAAEEPVKKFEAQIIKFLEDVAKGFNIALNLPRFGFHERIYLTEAELVLRGVYDGPYYVAARTYATLIYLTLFVNFLRDAFPTLQEANASLSTMLCHLDAQVFLDNIDVAATYLHNAAEQMELAYKARPTKPRPLLESIKESAQEMRRYYRENAGDITATNVTLVLAKNELCR